MPSGKLYRHNSRTKTITMHMKIRDHAQFCHSEICIHWGNNLLQCLYVSDIIPLKKFPWNLFCLSCVIAHIFDWSRLNPTGAGNCYWCKQPIWVKVVVISNFSLVLSHVLFCGPKLLLVVVRITLMLTDYTSPASQGQTKIRHFTVHNNLLKTAQNLCKNPLKRHIDSSLCVGSSDRLFNNSHILL